MTYQMNTNNASVKNHLESLFDEMMSHSHTDTYGDNVISLYAYENILYSYQGCEVVFDGLFPCDNDYIETLDSLADEFGYMCGHVRYPNGDEFISIVER